jgi:benzoate transport
LSTALQRTLAQGPVTGFQLTVLAVCVGLNMLDGFDVLAMSFAASGVRAGWHLLDSQLGALLSAGLVGMGVGSLTLGPCADRWGRRIIVLLSVALASLGMLGSAFARGYIELLLLRVLTGIGIGGTIASVAVIVSEYAPDKWRGTALAIYATGYSIGATIGGALAAYAIPRYGWRAAFAIGGTLSLLMLPLAWRKLPESLDFLLTRRPPSGLRRVNAVLKAMRQPSLAVLAEPLTVSNQSGQDSARAQLRLLMRPATLLVWILFFCTMAGFYFIVSWTPRLLNAAGLSAGQGMTGGVLLNLGGIAGCGLFAFAAARADTHRLLLGALIGSALLIVAFGLTMSRIDIALWTALLLGIIANAAMAGLYAVGPPLYPTTVRTTGMGWAIGIGRFGAILAPLASGALLDRGWLPAQLYFFFSAPFVVAAVAIFLIGPGRAQLPKPKRQARSDCRSSRVG